MTKKILALLLCALMLFSSAACGGNGSDAAGQAADKRAESWIETQIKADNLFSFGYDGKAFADFIDTWEKTTDTGTDKNGNKTYTLTYTSPDGVTAWAEVVYDAEYAAFDWVCYFKNDAAIDSKAITDILAMDTTVEIKNPILTTARGADMDEYAFQPITVDFAEQPQYSMAPVGGRSSKTSFPYYDISNGSHGVVGAIGWTGQWRAEFNHDDGAVNMKAGMSKTQIALHAGEDMRTPSMVLIFFDGDQDAGHNQLRRLILKSYTPADETGEPVKYLPLINMYWGGVTEADHQNVLSYTKSVNYDEYEIYWIDAGWYGNDHAISTAMELWYMQAGNWYYHENLLPEGFINLSTSLHEDGKELLVWFEPERAMEGTALVSDHPDYLLPKNISAGFYLYNFPSDEATDYLIDLIDGFIKRDGIDWYRQDFNCDPYDSWVYADSLEGENRVGMTEIKYFTNYYRYLDTLFERNPGLMMDNCASGGMRLDIEMMKRSVPLWRTDYSVATGNNASHADGVRHIGYNLTWWLPLSAGDPAKDGLSSVYNFRCAMSSGMIIRPENYSPNWMKVYIEEYKTCRELMTGDYYILSMGQGNLYTQVNAVYQYYLPETGEGFIVAFRPSGSSVDSDFYGLKGLEAESSYLLKNTDTGEEITVTGKVLMENGLNISLDTARSSTLIYITKQ